MQGWLAEGEASSGIAEAYATYVLPTLNVTASSVASFGIEQTEPGCGMWFVGAMLLWALIYIIPIGVLVFRFLWQIAYIIYLRYTCTRKNYSFFTFHSSFYVYPRPCGPFSFGPWIFLHSYDIDEQTLREVLVHEQTHVNQWHTADILLAEAVCILFWWNPAVHYVKRSVTQMLELECDQKACQGMTDEERKQQDRFETQKNVATISNNFNVLPLKRRIIMMNSRRTRRTEMVKYALFVPAAALLLFVSNIDSLARSIAKEMKPLANMEQTFNNPESIAPVIEEVQPVAEEPVVEQIETMVEAVAAVQDSVVPETTSTENVNTQLTRIPDEALWIIDQREATPEEVARLNPDDIESITVFREQTATDIWGDRGKNGVVEVKTKNAPKDDDEKGQIYDTPEYKPEYPGGEPALYQFLALNVKYPAVAQECGVQGRIIVSFVIEKDGSITEAKANPEKKVTNQLTEIMVTAKKPEATPEQKEYAEKYAAGLEQLKAEAVRVVSAMPKWKPGRHKDQPVRVRFMLPIVFRLQ